MLYNLMQMIFISIYLAMKKYLVLFFVLSAPNWAFSASHDPDFSQPMHLSGDSLEMNLNSGEGVYKGNFTAEQGSLKLEGSEIQFKQKQNRELDRIIAKGQPVRFQKKNYQTGELIKGSARKVTYDAGKLLVTLEGNAEISSDFGKSFKSPIITYGLTTGEIEALGNSKARVHIVIPPSRAKQSAPIVKN